MRKFGLIGYPITHSFSPGYFAAKFKKEHISDAQYDLYPISRIEDFDAIKGVLGINVTIPYKEAVIPYLDHLSEDAFRIGAVNTILYKEDVSIGYNTDTYGFEKSLVSLWGREKPLTALVLGTGGAAKAVWYVLENLGISFKKVSRKGGDIQYEAIDEAMVRNHRLIINTTPLGMAPYIDTCPNLPYHAISKHHILYDLIYNPDKTLFLIKGAEQGAKTKNGLEMLQLQAEKSWEIWNDS